MKIANVMFVREVPSPAAASRARSHWVLSFDAPEFLISRQADTVSITSRETGKTLLYPWCSVAAAVPEQPPAESVSAPPPAPSTKKRTA